MTTICVPTLQAALPSLPTESPVWFDMTHLLQGFDSQRGTQAADSAVSAGVMNARCWNGDRNLDPDYQDGKWHGWLDLSKRVRRGVKVGESEYSWMGAIRAAGTPYAGYALNEPTGVGTAYDQAGGVTGKHGTYAGGVSLGQAGLVGTTPDTAASLDGVDNHVDLPDAVWFSGDLSIVARVKVGAHNAWQRLIDFGQGQADDNVLFLLSSGTSGRLVFQVYAGASAGGSVTADAGDALSVGTEHTVGVSLSGATATLYKDGVAVKSGTVNVPASVTRTSNYVGRSNWAGDAYTNATIAHLWIWNDRALTAAQHAALHAASQGTHHERFHGYIDRIELQPDGPFSENAVLQCSDALAVLAAAPISGSRPQERSDQRIAAILALSEFSTETGWILDVSQLGLDTVLGPVSDQVLDAGQVEVQAAELSGTALPAIQEVERSEHGRFFAGRDGALVFYSRHRRMQAAMDGPLFVFGDRPYDGELPILPPGPAHSYDTAFVYNHVSITRINGTEQVRSTASRWPRQLPPYSVSLVTDEETGYLADYQLAMRQGRRPILGDLPLDPAHASDGQWTELLVALFARELFDVGQVKKRHPAGGDPLVFTVEMLAVREEWSISEAGALWGFGLALGEADTNHYFRLEDPVYGVLGLNKLSI